MNLPAMEAEKNQNGALFAGTVRHRVEEGFRLALPARWRRQPGAEEFFSMPDDRGQILLLIPGGEMRRHLERMGEDLVGGDRRLMLRHFFSRAFPCAMDEKGRITLPAETCRVFGLEGEVILAGAGTQVEVWNPERWRAVGQAESADFQRLAEGLGI